MRKVAGSLIRAAAAAVLPTTAAMDAFVPNCSTAALFRRAEAVERHDADALLDRHPAVDVHAERAGNLVRVYHQLPYIQPLQGLRYLTDVPAIAVAGDSSIELQSGHRCNAHGKQIPGLLTWEERRIARKKAIVSMERVRAYGGYGGPRTHYAGTPTADDPDGRPFAAIVSVAGPQFEVNYLEAEDFVAPPPGTAAEGPASRKLRQEVAAAARITGATVGPLAIIIANSRERAAAEAAAAADADAAGASGGAASAGGSGSVEELVPIAGIDDAAAAGGAPRVGGASAPSPLHSTAAEVAAAYKKLPTHMSTRELADWASVAASGGDGAGLPSYITPPLFPSAYRISSPLPAGVPRAVIPFVGRKPTWSEAHHLYAHVVASSAADIARSAAAASASSRYSSLSPAARAELAAWVARELDIVPIEGSGDFLVAATATAADGDDGHDGGTAAGGSSDARRPAYLLGGAYRRSIAEDMHLVLRGYDAWLAEANALATACTSSSTALAIAGSAGASGSSTADIASADASGTLRSSVPVDDVADNLRASAARAAVKSEGLLQLPAVGLGFFAEYLTETSIAHQLKPRFLQGLLDALMYTGDGSPFKHLRVLQLCDYMRDRSFHLLPAARAAIDAGAAGIVIEGDDVIVHGVRVVHAVRRSLLHFSEEELARYTCGVVNAGDAFALPGNEYGFCSVESMLGDNTTMRRGQVYLHNPWLLDERTHVPMPPMA